MPKSSSKIRTTIQGELNRRGWSVYQLVQAVDGKVSPDTVYRFVAGTRDITSKFLEPILDALDLGIVRKK